MHNIGISYSFKQLKFRMKERYKIMQIHYAFFEWFAFLKVWTIKFCLTFKFLSWQARPVHLGWSRSNQIIFVCSLLHASYKIFDMISGVLNITNPWLKPGLIFTFVTCFFIVSHFTCFISRILIDSTLKHKHFYIQTPHV